MEEIYINLEGFESYKVSNIGNFKSIKYGKERILKPTLYDKYLFVTLCKNGKKYKQNIHILVAMAFLGHKPNGRISVVNHIDNNQLNNHVDNLEITTTRINTTCHKTEPGIDWHKRSEKWRSRIHIKDKRVHLGYFDDKQDALDAYQKALNELKCK